MDPTLKAYVQIYGALLALLAAPVLVIIVTCAVMACG